MTSASAKFTVTHDNSYPNIIGQFVLHAMRLENEALFNRLYDAADLIASIEDEVKNINNVTMLEINEQTMNCMREIFRSSIDSNYVSVPQISVELSHDFSGNENIGCIGIDPGFELYDDEYFSPAAEFNCPICLENVLIDGSFEVEGCQDRFCSGCLIGHVTAAIKSRNFTTNGFILCPGVRSEKGAPCKCEVEIPVPTIQGILSPELWNEYQQATTSHSLDGQVLSGCYIRCPNQHCQNIFTFDSVDEKNRLLHGNPEEGYAFYCDPLVAGCGVSYCLYCKAIDAGNYGPGHRPHSCQQQKRRLAQEQAEKQKYEQWKRDNENGQQMFDQLIAREGWRPCPNCSTVISRNEGCDHMTCKNCRCNYCYVCGKYNRDNPQTRGDCGTRCQSKRNG